MIEQVKTCAVVGMGLMGTSLACALKETRICQEIVGIDTDEAILATAQCKGCINRGSLSLSDAIGEADLIILATPVRHIIRTLREIAPLVKHEAMIMDVGSTKTQIVAAMNNLPEHIQAIGGHPMSGPLTTGLESADADMFRDRVFVLTPTRRTGHTMLSFAKLLVCQIGARPVVLDAEHHDRLVAMISHLPRMLPLALLGTVQTMNDELAWTLAAGAFRESTNSATDNIPMWLDIMLTNSQGIVAAIHSLQDCLAQLAQCIESGDEVMVKALLEMAATEWQTRFDSLSDMELAMVSKGGR